MDFDMFWQLLDRTKPDKKFLFALFNEIMEEIGVITQKGSIQDASFVNVPRQGSRAGLLGGWAYALDLCLSFAQPLFIWPVIKYCLEKEGQALCFPALS